MRGRQLIFGVVMAGVAECAAAPASFAADLLRLEDGHLHGTVVIEETARPEIGLTIDIARVLRLDQPASTIVIGNPGIANATLTDERTLVMTGKAAGATNMIVMDEAGAEVANLLLRVGTSARPFVKVYNGLRRHSYSCAPNCEPVVAIGDENEYFQTVLSQTQARQEFSGTAGTGSP
ncbi:MAG TPA: pilus assembly protein N-terminal domain-containing protein [Afifellaceae bacterium]|nr:pilus assembly protein N-terminal domain-containing protein [Afifellaceae bacterium]